STRPSAPRDRRPLWVVGGVLLIAACAVMALVVYRLRGPVDWTEEWIAPPGFALAMSEISAGRPDDAERRLKSLFQKYRSPVWSRRASLAAGVARLRRREYAPANRALGRAESGGGPLAAFASLRRAEALLGADRPKEALEILERAGAGGS